MQKKTALIFSKDFVHYSYGPEHPFKGQRYLLAYELMHAYGLTGLPGSKICDGRPISEEDLLTFHTPEYLAKLKEFSTSPEPRADFRFGLGDLENPVFPGLFDWACLGAAGTVEAARLVVEEGYDIAFNPVGGWHHAHPGRLQAFLI